MYFLKNESMFRLISKRAFVTRFICKGVQISINVRKNHCSYQWRAQDLARECKHWEVKRKRRQTSTIKKIGSVLTSPICRSSDIALVSRYSSQKNWIGYFLSSPSNKKLQTFSGPLKSVRGFWFFLFKRTQTRTLIYYWFYVDEITNITLFIITL